MSYLLTESQKHSILLQSSVVSRQSSVVSLWLLLFDVGYYFYAGFMRVRRNHDA